MTESSRLRDRKDGGEEPVGAHHGPQHTSSLAPADALAPVLRDIEAVVFDTDGVITDSARVHAAAWKTAFDAFLRDHPPADPCRRRPFDVRDDYLRYVDGKSRIDGATAFLASRGTAPTAERVQAVTAYKERLFTERLREHGVDAYPGTVRLLNALRAAGVPLAAASASRHARELLTGARVLDLFDALVDGGEAARLGLPGKPRPDLFLEAARRLGVPADRTAVAEDALAGVEAGRRGGFALVIGVDRAAGADTREGLLRHGADIVVRDLGELLTHGTPS
ncbi:HAD-IA family hydrolase [Streptomyces sp. ME02-8801-2C]|uniref:HAD family hydrolase n=1 Tax=Streptomyces sp. ME02-8801-2C TaxID=3028680 RepID=UPI0029BDF07E|nr:HAD-IA family hydrolase [Streptomyces sp. ME02-8801-2C]MDX3458595.1 HAD-IA family hydrolase [Streptomyces sp. ME02-8801-2C]